MDAYDIVDWRRRVFALYAEIRADSDPGAAHARWRAVRDELFATHPASPLLPEQHASFTGLPVPDYDPAWRFELKVEQAEPQQIEVTSGTDGLVPFERLGVVEVPDVGTLDVWRLATYAGGIFLPVKDASAGRPGGTYGGGRYLLDTVKGADLGSDGERLVLDLNFAYNPSCAYDARWACPLAPPANRLPLPLRAGELAYRSS